jgi:hypothetical protein
MKLSLKALKKLDDTPPWEWSEDTGLALLDLLRDPGTRMKRLRKQCSKPLHWPMPGGMTKLKSTAKMTRIRGRRIEGQPIGKSSFHSPVARMLGEL